MTKYPAGRYWGSADKAELTKFYDGCSVRLSWNDGAMICEWYDDEGEARAFLRRLGWSA